MDADLKFNGEAKSEPAVVKSLTEPPFSAPEGAPRTVKSPIPFLRLTGQIEAISFLLLLCVAMPLKYVAGMPTAVKFAGWIHGVLFIVFCLALLRTMLIARWELNRGALVFVAALLPFGPFVVDRRMLAYDAEFRGRKSGLV